MQIIKNVSLLSVFIIIQSIYSMDSSIFDNSTAWVLFDQSLAMRVAATKNPIAKAHLTQKAYALDMHNKLGDIEKKRLTGETISPLITDLLNSIDSEVMKRESTRKKRLNIDRNRKLIISVQKNIHYSSTEKIYMPQKERPLAIMA